MGDLFEEDDANIDVAMDDFAEVDEEINIKADNEDIYKGFDARRRLESMLDDKRLRDELDEW